YGTPLYEQEAGETRGVRIKDSMAEAMRNHEKKPGGCTGVEVFFSLPLHCRFAIGTLSLLHRGAAMRQEMSGNFGIIRT
ncbi:hypothetical protein HMPREF1986_02290, partial [Oribacterium sp. oral taxon 078 str. F0263]|uniref:hypothetical protein n=1 Tax=Oribacterium sp. oral taxon 078 TaxID=652706 RepID=UPI0003AD786C